jgi:predicted RNA binding protein YcfA (HicA-like mRNA interferase family)
MPKLPRISGPEAIRALERMGFSQARQKGSHVVMKKGSFGCVVPMHKVLAVGTLASILRQARLTPEEFLENL